MITAFLLKIAVLVPLILLIIAEFVGDFLLQDRHMAVNKSKDPWILLQHLFAIFCCIAATATGLGLPAIYLALCYIVVHGIQDWFIWRGYGLLVYKRIKKRLDKTSRIDRLEEELKAFEIDKDYVEDKVFWDTVGLDRVLHIITLVILYGVFFL